MWNGNYSQIMKTILIMSIFFVKCFEKERKCFSEKHNIQIVYSQLVSQLEKDLETHQSFKKALVSIIFNILSFRIKTEFPINRIY